MKQKMNNYKQKPHTLKLFCFVVCWMKFFTIQKCILKSQFILFSMYLSLWCLHRYRKSQNRLLKVCYVPATSAVLIAFFSSFLLLPLTVLIKQTRQAVHTIKQSIYLDVYGLVPVFFINKMKYRILSSIVRTFLHWKWCWNIPCTLYTEGSWQRV